MPRLRCWLRALPLLTLLLAPSAWSAPVNPVKLPPVDHGVAVALPVEVLYPETGEKLVAFTVTDAVSTLSPLRFDFRLFVETENIGQISINNYAFRLNNSEVDFVQPIKKAFGGMGSGYSVFDLSKTLPAGTLRPGLNVIRFSKDRVSDVHLGYRVLSFNFVALTNGKKLIADSSFVEKSPSSVEGLDTTAASIEAGRQLWSNAPLQKSPLNRGGMKAHCMDCHTASGYDLSYFGYSNHAIVQRSIFHGLNQTQGKQIASYIRSLSTPGVGRPWNPPYQPGPGLSSKPVNEWAAGAGADAILARDADALPYAFPKGIPAAYDFKGERLDLTNVPVAMELPVWNHWLPRIHPMEEESMGPDLLQTGFYRRISTYASSLGEPERGQFAGLRKIGKANQEITSLFLSEIAKNPAFMTRIHRDSNGKVMPGASQQDDIAAYSLRQWRLLKTWEAIQINDLEGLGREVGRADPSYPKQMPVRAFDSGDAFQVAPHKAGIRRLAEVERPGDGNGLRDPKPNDLNWKYFTLSWYYLQMLLWDNFQQGDGFTHWPYMTGFSTIGSSDAGSDRYDFPFMRMVSTLKSIEAFSLYPPGGKNDRRGFNNSNGYLQHISQMNRPDMTQIDVASKRQVINSIVGGFTRLAGSYPVKQLNNLNIYEDARCANKMMVPASTGCTGSTLYWLTFDWRASGDVDRATVNRLIDIYSKVWPGFDWNCSRANKSVQTCLASNKARGVVF